MVWTLKNKLGFTSKNLFDHKVMLCSTTNRDTPIPYNFLVAVSYGVKIYKKKFVARIFVEHGIFASGLVLFEKLHFKVIQPD